MCNLNPFGELFQVVDRTNILPDDVESLAPNVSGEEASIEEYEVAL